MIPKTFYGRLTLIAAVIEALIVMGLEAYIAAEFIQEVDVTVKPYRGIPVYLIIFIFSQFFQIILCWDALRQQNTIQIIGFVIFTASVCAYSIFQYIQITSIDVNLTNGRLSAIKIPLLIIPIVLGISVLLFCYLAFRLYLEFGWKIYKKIGADPKMRNMYRAYQIFLMLLKLDFFFFLAFSAQFLYLVLDIADPEFYLTIVALPITALIIVLAVYGVRREDKWIMFGFIGGLLLAVAYFIYKLVRMHDPSQQDKYSDSKRYLTFFSALTLILVVLTLVNSVVCLRNFGKGLKQHLFNTKQGNAAMTYEAPERAMIE